MGASQAYALLENELESVGFGDQYKKYLVYYDGPSVEDGVCGTGGGTFDSGPSFAFVWLAGCGSDYPTDAIAAHELLHALGALPAGAPNACTAADDPFGVDDSGHPCDSPTDVLYPAASPGVPLSQLVLDYNHDDYYAHSGTWIDIQDSLWMHLLNVPELALTVTISGPGGVFSDEPGLICAQTCVTQWDQGSTPTLTATPATGQRFIGWTGGCAGNGDCSLKLDSATSVTAKFGPSRVPFHLTVSGSGKVTCQPQCRSTAAAGYALVLRAVPAKGWKLSRWSGACKGSALTCRPSTDVAVSVHAAFAKRPVKKAKKKR